MNAKIVGCSYIREIKIENGSVTFMPTGEHNTKTDSTLLSILNAVEDGHKILKLVPVDEFKSDDARIEEFVFTIEEIKAITFGELVEKGAESSYCQNTCLQDSCYGFRISLSTLRRMVLDAKYKHVSTTEYVTDLV